MTTPFMTISEKIRNSRQQCQTHLPAEIISFCSNPQCLQSLCSSCLSYNCMVNSQLGAQPPVLDFKSLLENCGEKLKKVSEYLSNLIEGIKKEQEGVPGNWTYQDIEVEKIKRSKQYLIDYVEKYYRDLIEHYHLTSKPLETRLGKLLEEIKDMETKLGGKEPLEVIKKVYPRNFEQEILEVKANFPGRIIHVSNSNKTFWSCRNNIKVEIDYSRLYTCIKEELQKYASIVFQTDSQEKKPETQMDNEYKPSPFQFPSCNLDYNKYSSFKTTFDKPSVTVDKVPLSHGLFGSDQISVSKSLGLMSFSKGMTQEKVPERTSFGGISIPKRFSFDRPLISRGLNMISIAKEVSSEKFSVFKDQEEIAAPKAIPMNRPSLTSSSEIKKIVESFKSGLVNVQTQKQQLPTTPVQPFELDVVEREDKVLQFSYGQTIESKLTVMRMPTDRLKRDSAPRQEEIPLSFGQGTIPMSFGQATGTVKAQEESLMEISSLPGATPVVQINAVNTAPVVKPFTLAPQIEETPQDDSELAILNESSIQEFKRAKKKNKNLDPHKENRRKSRLTMPVSLKKRVIEGPQGKIAVLESFMQKIRAAALQKENGKVSVIKDAVNEKSSKTRISKRKALREIQNRPVRIEESDSLSCGSRAEAESRKSPFRIDDLTPIKVTLDFNMQENLFVTPRNQKNNDVKGSIERLFEDYEAKEDQGAKKICLSIISEEGEPTGLNKAQLSLSVSEKKEIVKRKRSPNDYEKGYGFKSSWANTESPVRVREEKEQKEQQKEKYISISESPEINKESRILNQAISLEEILGIDEKKKKDDKTLPEDETPVGEEIYMSKKILDLAEDVQIGEKPRVIEILETPNEEEKADQFSESTIQKETMEEPNEEADKEEIRREQREQEENQIEEEQPRVVQEEIKTFEMVTAKEVVRMPQAETEMDESMLLPSRSPFKKRMDSDPPLTPHYYLYDGHSDNEKRTPIYASKAGFERSKTKIDFTLNLENYFKPNAERKLLHFFQWRSKNLHTLSLENLEKYSSLGVVFETLTLNIDFDIPDYHNSLITPDGDIYITGGQDIKDATKKYNEVYKVSFEKQTLVPKANMIIQRDSHALVYHNDCLYSIGGITVDAYGKKHVTNKCEKYNIKEDRWERIADLTLPVCNHSACVFQSTYIFCFGGRLQPNKLSNNIFRYNIEKDIWLRLELKTVMKNPTNFALTSQAASFQINERQMFVFGGYQANRNISSQSFLFEYCATSSDYSDFKPNQYWKRFEEDNIGQNNDRSNNQELEDQQLCKPNQGVKKKDVCIIKGLNKKDLPFAAPFWDKQVIAHNGKIYCLQNVITDNNPKLSYSTTRRLLVFDGEKWSNLN